MDVKRYFRGPVIWVVLAVVAVLAVMQLVSSAGGPKSVDTSVVMDAIHKNQVVSAKVVGGSSSSVEVLTLLRKPDAAKVAIDVKYVGFDIPNEFVVGYGLDYAQRFRGLPFIGTLAPHVYSS